MLRVTECYRRIAWTAFTETEMMRVGGGDTARDWGQTAQDRKAWNIGCGCISALLRARHFGDLGSDKI